MQRPLMPDPAVATAARTATCELYYCDEPPILGSLRCLSHQPMRQRRSCPSCNGGAVIETGGKLVCSSCGWGRSTLPRAKRRRR